VGRVQPRTSQGPIHDHLQPKDHCLRDTRSCPRVLGARSAIEWIIERYQVKTDKVSSIVNDPNDWSREVGEPRYILDLLARIVTVSMETVKIVNGLPSIDFTQLAG
jgi:hypothetical protein